jgi:hypothetical protein
LASPEEEIIYDKKSELNNLTEYKKKVLSYPKKKLEDY